MMSASVSLPSLRRAAFASLRLLRGCLRVGFRIITLVCVFVVFCDAFGAESNVIRQQLLVCLFLRRVVWLHLVRLLG